MTCRCGRPALPEDSLCARCRYYASTFNPPPPVFESKKDKARWAIKLRKMMKQDIFRMVVR